jgi:hypothetical protein
MQVNCDSKAESLVHIVKAGLKDVRDVMMTFLTDE